MPMLKFRHYLFIAVAVFMAVVLANLPASVLFATFEPKLLPKALQLGKAHGSVWQGRIGLNYLDMAFSADWDLTPSQALRGRLAADIGLVELRDSKTNAAWVKAKCFGSIFSSTGCEDVEGFLPASLVNRLANKQFSIERDITLQALAVTYQSQHFTWASGEINWPGGQVTYQDPARGSQQVVLPALTIKVAEQEGRLQASLMPQGTEDVLVDVRVDGQGMADLAVRKRMLDLLGQSWGKPVSPDFVVFEIQQPLF